DDHGAGHDVLGDAGADVPAHAYGCTLVHSRAVVPDVAEDLDLVPAVEPARNGVRPVRVHDLPAPFLGVVQALVQLAQRRRRQIDDLGRDDRHQTSAFSHAYTTDGSGSHI